MVRLKLLGAGVVTILAVMSFAVSAQANHRRGYSGYGYPNPYAYPFPYRPTWGYYYPPTYYPGPPWYPGPAFYGPLRYGPPDGGYYRPRRVYRPYW
jgi:hypothetical protein